MAMVRAATAVDQAVTTVVFSKDNPELVGESAREDSRHLGRRGLDKALRTVAVLQSTLEVEQLIRLFSREISSSVTHSSIIYQNQNYALDITAGRNAKHALAFEIIVEKKNMGQITFTRGKPFTDRESALLEFFLGSLVYPLRNALQYKDAFQASMTDPLTGVYNRTVMEASLKREIGLAERHHTPVSLIILDLDGFKAVNDKYGHEIGDKLIKSVALTISKDLRKTDLLSRYGGDEFTILLHNTNRLGAAVLANNIREQVEENTYVLEGINVNITASMGVATTNGKTGQDLFSRADEALYQAKREGRNRVRVAD